MRCFNTQPPEGGWASRWTDDVFRQSFNTQPPEGGWLQDWADFVDSLCFNTQPPEGGWEILHYSPFCFRLFQHTAA